MFSALLKDVPRGVKIVIGATVALAIFLFLRGHLYYVRNPVYLGGLIVIEIVLTCLWHLEIVFFPLLLVTFLWAGMNLPFIGIPATARWFILGVAAVAGFVIWMRERRHTYGALHLVALFCICSGLVSAIVSAEPALAYLGGGWAIFGNPNSLGAVMGGVMAPFLVWGYLIAENRGDRNRRMLALGLTGVLIYTSASRAGMLAAALSVLTMCFALRRQRLLLHGAFLVMLFLALAAMWNPTRFEEFASDATNNVIYKGKNKELGVFQSRQTPWQQTAAVIREHPLFESGFGTSDLGQWAERPNLSMAPSTGGLYTRERTNREHGNSYLALAEYLGLLGIIPFLVLLYLLLKMIVRVVIWMRRTSNPYHCAIPLAMMLLSGIVHAFFEDRLTVLGYYLTVAFWLRDLLPESVPVAVRSISGAHPQLAKTPQGMFAHGR